MKKILILGASGMAGHMIYYYFSSLKKYHIFTVCHTMPLNENSFMLDIYNTEKLTKILIDTKPDIIINCIGVLIKGAQKSIENTVYINAYYPHLLVHIIEKDLKDVKLIHISTDCVFSGKKGNYTVDDIKDALDVYGMTKNLGEIINKRDLTIRTSIIGPELKKNGEGLFHWLFANRGGGVTGYTKSIWGGVTTLELAKFIDFAIDKNLAGLHHFSNNARITKYALLRLLAEQFNLSVKIKAIDGIVTDKSIISSMSDYIVPSYAQMIKNLYLFMSENRDIYTQYEE